MKKSRFLIIALAVVAVVILASGVALAAGGRGSASGTCGGDQARLQDGTGENCPDPESCPGAGDQDQQRLQLRDGTGGNCPNLGTTTEAGAQARATVQTQTRSCNGSCAGNTIQSQVESQSRVRTGNDPAQ